MSGASFSLGVPPARPEAPFPAFADDIIQKIEQAICFAWNLLAVSKSLDLASAPETTITAALQKYIVDVLNHEYVDGFIPEIFHQPTRDASVEDFSGKHLEKKPDLTFYISSAAPLSMDKGYFFECKPVGDVATYFGKNGLQRFCDGRYAWAMPHAGMIAYVQRKRTPLTATDAIETNVASGSLCAESHYEDNAATYHPISVSVHTRNFSLLNGKAPGSIAIRHIWLKS